MTRENAQAKGRRLLTEGRLRVLAVDESSGTTSAECRGDSGLTYGVGRDEAGRWHCTCEAKGRCSHQVALQLVVAFKRWRSL
jgi:uncharacterized Zn finger protein